MVNQTVTIDRNELTKLAEMLQEVQDRLESLELASDPELMESLKKSKEEIAKGEVVDFDDL